MRHRSDGALRTAKMVDLTVLEHGDALKAGQEVDFLHLVRDHPSIVSSYEHFIYQNTYLVIIMVTIPILTFISLRSTAKEEIWHIV